MTGNFLMTQYAGIEGVAALEPDRNDIEIRTVVRALSALVNVDPVRKH